MQRRQHIPTVGGWPGPESGSNQSTTNRADAQSAPQRRPRRVRKALLAWRDDALWLRPAPLLPLASSAARCWCFLFQLLDACVAPPRSSDAIRKASRLRRPRPREVQPRSINTLPNLPKNNQSIDRSTGRKPLTPQRRPAVPSTIRSARRRPPPSPWFGSLVSSEVAVTFWL